MNITVSIGNVSDMEILVSHRLRMWRSIYPGKEKEIDESSGMTRDWIFNALEGGRLIPFIARTDGGKVAGSGCILIKEDQPRPSSSKTDNPYLLSMYTETEFRNMGVATEIVKESMKWSEEHGYDRMTLHASEEGRHIYEKLGFLPTNEMRIWLRH